jgi:hypothetical protein
MLNLLTRVAAALLALTPLAGALPKVSRLGKYLYTDEGNRFFIKGIAYQTQGRESFLLSQTYSDRLRI